MVFSGFIELLDSFIIENIVVYIDDVIFCIESLIDKAPLPNLNFNKMEPDPSSSWAPHKIFNIGNSQPKNLMEYIAEIEKNLKLGKLNWSKRK